MPPLLSSGLKRKREVVDDEASHGLQRQSILDISMVKLRTSPSRRIEPCLRRSVLILNTLKHIETELQSEGVIIHTTTEAAMNNIPEMSTTELTLDPLPDMSTFISPLPISVPMQLDGSGVESSESGAYFGRDSSAVVDLMPCKPIFESSLAQASSPLVGLESLSNASAEMPKSHQTGDSNNNSVAQVPYASCSTPMGDPFGDIDVSLDFDLMAWSSTLTSLPVATTSSIAPSASSSSSTPVPLSPTKLLPSLTIEDILHSFPHPSFASGLDTPSPPAPISPVLNSQCSTYCRTDSSLDDLENIMQILVGL
ncbi:hypothetical protein BaRGS_00015279 [Batillaria attramentaria]|uniref:SERTA domain-containing protein n=1 Tax=Batillaria attramentaria TaxID=370345 RepID=A0ABD0L1I8_9CAEN